MLEDGCVLISDVVPKESRVWVKSEWGPASQDWPAVSFSKKTVGEMLRREFRPGRDVIIYIGTSNPATTEHAEHRQRLLSAVSIEPQQVLETRECVPAASWDEAQRQFRGRWFWSMPALDIWEIDSFPLAYDVCPITYSQLGLIVNRGNLVELAGGERDAVLRLPVRPVEFMRPRKASEFANAQRLFLNLTSEIKSEIGRMVAGIYGRVSGSGTVQVSLNPKRTMSETDTHVMLGSKWREQKGRCSLCNGPLIPGTKNYLLQCSPDRIDSQNERYDAATTWITHLGCNLAKNKVSLAVFEDWLIVVRGEISESDVEVARATIAGNENP